jgi:hypothetical protein
MRIRLSDTPTVPMQGCGGGFGDGSGHGGGTTGARCYIG